MLILHAEYFAGLLRLVWICFQTVNVRFNQTRKKDFVIFLGMAVGALVAWATGHSILALVTAGILMLFLVGGFLQNFVFKLPFDQGEDAEQWTINTPSHFPGDWEEEEHSVRRLFATDQKGQMDDRRFLEHINAIEAGQQPVWEDVSDALRIKMIYEYQRKNGSLRCNKKGGNPMVDAVDAMRRLSDNERPEFIEFWNNLVRGTDEWYANQMQEPETKTW